jgi:hypothetical protein
VFTGQSWSGRGKLLQFEFALNDGQIILLCNNKYIHFKKWNFEKKKPSLLKRVLPVTKLRIEFKLLQGRAFKSFQTGSGLHCGSGFY